MKKRSKWYSERRREREAVEEKTTTNMKKRSKWYSERRREREAGEEEEEE
jgi:hypothetical protein